MIKFLRKIRQNMINEGKTTKYLIYAIGEIILVVIGILIALQINNWNEAKKERQQEIKYLFNLKNDLQVDLKNLKMIEQDKQLKVTSALELIKMDPIKSLQGVIKVDSLVFNVWIWYTFQPRSNTQQELISSGSLNIIKNDSIKNLLLNIKQTNENIAVVREHIRREYDMYLYDPSIYNRENFPMVNMETINIYTKTIDTMVSTKEKNRFIKESNFILNNATIHNGLKLAIMNHRYMLTLFGDLKKRYKPITYFD